MAQHIAQLIHEKQGEDIVILDVSGPLVIADHFIIATARNSRHARAIAQGVESAMKQQGLLRRSTAGMEGESNWVLLDFDEVVVQIFQPDARSFYDLEGLWGDVPRIPFEPSGEPETASGDLSPSWESFPDSTGTL